LLRIFVFRRHFLSFDNPDFNFSRMFVYSYIYMCVCAIEINYRTFKKLLCFNTFFFFFSSNNCKLLLSSTSDGSLLKRKAQTRLSLYSSAVKSSAPMKHCVCIYTVHIFCFRFFSKITCLGFYDVSE